MIGIIIYTVLTFLFGLAVGLFISVPVIERLESKIKILEMKPARVCNDKSAAA